MEKKADPAIERFLSRAMTPEEQHAFQARLNAEPALVAELAFYQALWLHRDEQAKARWAAKGKALFRETGQPAAPLRSTFFATPYRWAAAATLALLVTAAGFWFVTHRQDPYQQLYSANYEPLPASGQLSGATGATPEQKIWDKAFELYALGKYDQAIAEVNQLKPATAQVYLFAGSCYLEQNRPAEAIRAFEQVDPAALSLYQRAQFDIALAHIRARNIALAQAQLQRIADDPESNYRGRARALREKLGEIKK